MLNYDLDHEMEMSIDDRLVSAISAAQELASRLDELHDFILAESIGEFNESQLMLSIIRGPVYDSDDFDGDFYDD